MEKNVEIPHNCWECAKCGEYFCKHKILECPYEVLGYDCSLRCSESLCEECYQKHILEEHMDLPKHDEKLEATCGYLSPDGRLYKCDYGFHKQIEKIFNFDDEKSLDEMGWIKLQHKQWYSDYNAEHKTYVNQAQYDTIYEWSVKHVSYCMEDIVLR
jgi:hypothetical protein